MLRLERLGGAAGLSELRKGVVNAILLTPSGALSPGPLTAAGVAAGLGLGPLGGALVALGHLAVELPYYLLLVRLMARVESALGRARSLLDIVAGGFMLVFALLLASTALSLLSGSPGVGAGRIIASPVTAFVAGAVLTGANAYFLAWWVTVGKPIVDSASSLGLPGALAVYAVHYSYDIGWLSLVAALGGLAAGPRILAAVLAGLALVLGLYGARFLASGLRGLLRG